MKVEITKIERSSGNVFKDLGYPDADAHLLKAEPVTCFDGSFVSVEVAYLSASKRT